MKQPIIIQYDIMKLDEQHPVICASRMKALKKMISDVYVRTTELSLADPPELWLFALGKSEPIETFTDKENVRAKGMADRFRQLDSQFAVALETCNQLGTERGTPSLRETIQSLTSKAKDDDELANWLSKLVALHRRPLIARKEYDQARKDSDKTTRFLIQNWIQDPLQRNWATASFCFFSDRAMAKLIYFLLNKKRLPVELRDKAPERIRKLYESLGLIPAKPRAIKDIRLENRKIHWVPFNKRVRAGV